MAAAHPRKDAFKEKYKDGEKYRSKMPTMQARRGEIIPQRREVLHR
jgi:hypothetical protein